MTEPVMVPHRGGVGVPGGRFVDGVLAGKPAEPARGWRQVGSFEPFDLVEAQALGRREKYQLRDSLSAYEIAKLRGVAPGAFLERMAFNWMIGNCNAHAKNYGILEPGTERARLAPAYDVVCTEVYPELDRTLALRLG